MAISIACFAGTVSAQDDLRVGLTMGYPATVGVLWQAADRVALRPEVSVQRSSGESTSFGSLTVFSSGGTPTTTTTTSVFTTETWQVGVGLSALFYLSKHDALRTYVSPRWAYTRSSSSSGNALPADASSRAPSGTLTASGSTSTGHVVTGSFGVQYALARRFSLYGEVGVGFSRIENSPTVLPAAITLNESVSRTVSTRSGVGVVFYF